MEPYFSGCSWFDQKDDGWGCKSANYSWLSTPASMVQKRLFANRQQKWHDITLAKSERAISVERATCKAIKSAFKSNSSALLKFKVYKQVLRLSKCILI